MATLEVGIDARKAKQGAAEFNRAANSMKRNSGSATKSIESGFSKAMKRILMFGGAGGAIYTLKKFVDAASDSQETMNKFNVVFGKNAREVAKWSEEFGDKVGRSTQDVQKWMAGVQDLFVPLGFAREKAEEFSKSIVQLAVDVGSFQNIATKDVIRDFNSALVRNHETVRKYGIVISETSLAQEAINQGLGKAYKDLTDLEKVQLRYALLQKGSTDAQGDAVRSMNDHANQMYRLKANAHELATELGGPLMDSLTGLVVNVNENSDSWKAMFKVVGEGTAEVLSGFKELRAAVMEFAPVYDEFLKKQKKVRVGPGGFGGFGAGTMGAPPSPLPPESNLPQGTLDIYPRGYQRLEEMNNRVRQMKLDSFVGPPEPTEREVAERLGEITELSAESQKQIYNDTRDHIDRVRHMDYLTRQEKIQNLEAYSDSHAETFEGR